MPFESDRMCPNTNGGDAAFCRHKSKSDANPDLVPVCHDSLLAGIQSHLPTETRPGIIALNSFSQLNCLPQVGLEFCFSSQGLADRQAYFLTFVVLYLQFALDRDKVIVIAAAMRDLLLPCDLALFVAGSDIRRNGDLES